MRSFPIQSWWVHFVSPDRAAVVTIHPSGWEKHQGKSSVFKLGGQTVRRASEQLAATGPFLCTRQNERS
jgi:hypothetical protein